MGCFSACFGRCSSKTEKPQVLDQKIEFRKESQIADTLKIDAEIEDKNEEELNSSARKKVTFHSNLKGNEEVCKTQSPECVQELEVDKAEGSATRKNELRAFLYSKEKEEEKADGVQDKNQPKVLSDSSEKEKKPEEEKTNGEQGKNLVKILSDSNEKEKTEEEKTGEQGKNQAKVLSNSSEKEKTGTENKNGKQGRDRVEDVLSDSSQSSLFTYPLNNRYKNCATSDEECDDTAMNESNFADDEVVSTSKVKDGHAGPMIQLESSESLFSLSIDSRRQSSTPEIGEKEVSSPFKPCDKAMNGQGGGRDRTQYVDSVLTPIENLSQWKVLRTKTTSSMKCQEEENVNNSEDFTRAFVGKENVNLENQFIIPFSEKQPPTVKHGKKTPSCPRDDVIAVDTSLSTWLVESENNPIKENSPGSVGNSSSKKMMSHRSFEDRPILGALTLDEFKQMSRQSSPTRSPTFSPDETPIIGTVGSYWRHTGQAADAHSGTSCKQLSGGSSMSGHCRRGRMNIQTSSFQTRLEEAMESVAAEVQ